MNISDFSFQDNSLYSLRVSLFDGNPYHNVYVKTTLFGRIKMFNQDIEIIDYDQRTTKIQDVKLLEPIYNLDDEY